MQRVFATALLGCAAALFAAGCGPSSSGPVERSQGAAYETPSRQISGAGAGAGSNQRLRQADFLNRLRKSDPQFQTIEKAVLNENNELGLILSRGVELDSIPRLMKAMLTQMASEFPGQDLTVVAYAPTQPPRRIGTGHLEARTGTMTYARERQ